MRESQRDFSVTPKTHQVAYKLRNNSFHSVYHGGFHGELRKQGLSSLLQLWNIKF